MHIQELKEGELENGEEKLSDDVYNRGFVVLDARRALIGAGARLLFYPTLLYNVVRNKFQSEFRWWDVIDEFVLLGAVPFPTDVPHLKQLGVHGVVTLNEPYETLVPTSLYHAHEINHLVIPTRDYCFAPSLGDICQAVDFIHKNASCGKTTYVHCKAGRGRSTTIVICYLVQHKHMTPYTAFKYVRSIRPRVLLASSQWQAVEEYYRCRVKERGRSSHLDNPVVKNTGSELTAFEDSSIVMVTEADLIGYDETRDSGVVGNEIWAKLSLVYRVQIARVWLRCHAPHKMLEEKLVREGSCSVEADQSGGLGLDIHVY